VSKLKDMKRFLFLFLFVIGLASCQKEVIYPTDELPANVPSANAFNGISMWGEFLITDGVMYVDNHETGVKTVYNHFGVGKDTSSLRWGGGQFEIETIVRNKTTYSFYKPLNFPGYGKFVLNGDTSKHYALYLIGRNSTIIEDPVNPQNLLGGSSRPFSGQTISITDSTVAIQIQEVEGSINGYNCHYWTQLTLKKIKSW